MAEPEIWGFTRPTADRLTILARESIVLRPAPTQRSRQPRMIGSAGAKLIKTPPAGIAGRIGTAVPSAVCAEFKIVAGVLTATGETLTAYNPWPISIPADYYVTAVQEQISLEWIIQFPGLLNVRWLDPNLEQTSNGNTYNVIDTAVNCT